MNCTRFASKSKWWIRALALALSLSLTAIACGSDRAPDEVISPEPDDPDEIVGFEEFEELMTPRPGFGEASANFDASEVSEFLPRITPLVDSGFGSEQIAQVQGLVETVEVNHQESLEFPIGYMGEETVLQVAVFMDDVDAADLAFFTAPELADKITEEIIGFMGERGN